MDSSYKWYVELYWLGAADGRLMDSSYKWYVELYWLGAADGRPWILLINGMLNYFK